MKGFQFIGDGFSHVLYVLQLKAAELDIQECDTEKYILHLLLAEYAE